MYRRPPLHSWRSPSFRYADFLSWLWTFQGIHISSVAAMVQSSPKVSNAFRKSTNTIYWGRSCSMHFPWSCRRQKIMSTVLLFERKPHCVPGTTSGVMWLEICSVGSEQISCRHQKEEIYLVNYQILFGLLFCKWWLCWHPSRLVVHRLTPILWWSIGAVCWTS